MGGRQTWVVDLSGLIIQPALGLLSFIILDRSWGILIPVIRLGGVWVGNPRTYKGSSVLH
jgi:hypothetical protein